MGKTLLERLLLFKIYQASEIARLRALPEYERQKCKFIFEQTPKQPQVNKEKKLKVQLLDLKKQYEKIREEILTAAREVFDSQHYILGPKVEELERKIASYCRCKYAVGVSSGTDALLLSLMTAGVGFGDLVLTTPYTFFATVGAIARVGARPVFVDIDENTFNINPDLIEEKITNKTKAILPVHLFGQPADMSKIMKIARKYKLKVIEDCAQAHGAEIKGRKVGSFGDIGCFSFYPTKNIASLRGGAITTNSKTLMKKCRSIINHGITKNGFYYLGYNYIMTDIEAVIAIEQLKKLEANTEKRIKNANYLNKGLKNINGIITPNPDKNIKHVFHQYSIRVSERFKLSRDKLVRILIKKGISARVYYSMPIYKQPLYQKIGYKCSMPISEKISKQILSLPIYQVSQKKN